MAKADDTLNTLASVIHDARAGFTRIVRTLEPIQEQIRELVHEVERLARAFATARDRGDFCNFQLRLRLVLWMARWIGAAKSNPSHRSARFWLGVQHLTPKQIAELLPYVIMDMHDLRVPQRKGRPGRVAASTLTMVGELDDRIQHTSELPTTAARRLLVDKGFRGEDVKGRADYLVRVWKDRALKSR